MPICLCGTMSPRHNNSNRHRQQGFTLIELMVVMMVIAVVVGMVTLSAGTSDSQALVRKTAETFMARAQYVSEQAVLKGETYGLFVEPRAQEQADIPGQRWCYYWRRVRDSQWDVPPELAEDYCLPEDLALEVTLDEKLWEYDPELEFAEPVLGFYPSGDASGEVELVIYRSQTTAAEDDSERIQINPLGELVWVTEKARLEAGK